MRSHPCLALLLPLGLLLEADAVHADGTDLCRVYKATLDYAEGAFSHDWTCGPEDVWEIASFGYKVSGRFEVALGPGTVTFGKHGTNALWAVVVPREPGRIQSQEGGEEKVSSLWMRFHPACVGDLFPAKTVRGNGDPGAVHWARRVCWARMNDCWQAEMAPIVPWKHSVVIDADTSTGGRRWYMVDTRGNSAKYYEGAAVPAPPSASIEPADALRAFDGAWAEFDRTYAKFGLRPEVHWERLRARYRPLAGASTTAWEAAGAVALLLSHLRDLHVSVEVGGEFVPVYHRPRLYNGNPKADQVLLGGKGVDLRRDLDWVRTRDGLGFLSIHRLTNRQVVAAFDEALEALADTWGLIVDLRFNGGGDEPMAIEMAGRIVDEERVYSVNCYRDGPGHGDMGPRYERRCPPRGPWRWRSPVVVLIGQKTFSSAESFALMLAVCPHVTSMGDRTGGSSGNPKLQELPGGIVVRVPRWNDMAPDGTPVEDLGVQPEVPVKAGLADFESRDPVLEQALGRLRRIPGEKRRPGRREK